jgi:hypothetical protein
MGVTGQVFDETLKFSLCGELYFISGLYPCICLVILFCMLIYGIAFRGEFNEKNLGFDLCIDYGYLWVNERYGDASFVSLD